MTIDLHRLGFEVPPAPKPIGNFRNTRQVGSLLFISGQGPRRTDGMLMTGKVGAEVSVSEAYDHARLTGLNILSVMLDAIGDLQRVKQFVKLLGLVNAVPEFAEHPAVINGCSDLFTEVFGEIGQHARSAIGVSSLPNNISVEIEAIVELHD